MQNKHADLVVFGSFSVHFWHCHSEVSVPAVGTVGKQVFSDSATSHVLERCKVAVTCWIFREQAASFSRFMSRNPKQNLLIPHLRA
jgi:hypothetical protein